MDTKEVKPEFGDDWFALYGTDSSIASMTYQVDGMTSSIAKKVEIDMKMDRS